RYAVKFLYGELQGTIFIRIESALVKWNKCLDRSFPESFVAPDDHRSSIILHRCCQNFGSRCRKLIDHNYQRAVIENRSVFVFVYFHLPVTSANLYDRAFGDKQSGDFNHLFQGAAAIVPQIENQTFYI